MALATVPVACQRSGDIEIREMSVMAITTGQKEPASPTMGAQADRGSEGRHPTTEQMWDAIRNTSFAILGYVTPSGEPRSSGVVYKVIDRRIYVAVAPDSWKAKHVGKTGRVAVTVPVRRGGLLSLVAPIPPATISFHGAATIHPPGSPEVRPLLRELGSLLPAERQASASIIEVLPEGWFVTYAVGTPLHKMRDPLASRARVPVSRQPSPEGGTKAA
jgi:pyridoxamine 5'-phosphate oxidase-like protein